MNLHRVVPLAVVALSACSVAAPGGPGSSSSSGGGSTSQPATSNAGSSSATVSSTMGSSAAGSTSATNSSRGGTSGNASSTHASSANASSRSTSGTSAGSGSSSYTRPDAGNCAGAFLDQAGLCRAPNDGVYPAACCAPYDCNDSTITCERLPPVCNDGETATVLGTCWGPCVESGLCATSPEELCQTSGGTWTQQTCGHALCGNPPPCAAVIPGCNCGPNANYVEGRGCVTDNACLAHLGESCGGAVSQPRLCENGLVCVPPDGGVGGTGTCHLQDGLVCSNGFTCPQGSQCCYPCGIPGCDSVCQVWDGGCPLLP